jgi:hypothetical protein
MPEANRQRAALRAECRCRQAAAGVALRRLGRSLVSAATRAFLPAKAGMKPAARSGHRAGQESPTGAGSREGSIASASRYRADRALPSKTADPAAVRENGFGGGRVAVPPSGSRTVSTGSSDRGCAIGGYVWLPGAEEPTISITMPTTDKPLLRDRYRVKGEQKNEIGGVRRNNARRDGRAYI